MPEKTVAGAGGEPQTHGTEETDVAMIGAGPVVFQRGTFNMRCHVIDVLEVPGG